MDISIESLSSLCCCVDRFKTHGLSEPKDSNRATEKVLAPLGAMNISTIG